MQPGFRADSVLAFDVGLPAAPLQQLIARLQALPPVRAAGAISFLPLGGGENAGQFAVEGNLPVTPGNEPSAERRWVTPGHFAAMGIPIRQGRVFTPADTADQPRVVVTNDALARQFFGSATRWDPLALVSTVRSELKALDPLLRAVNIRTSEQVVSKAAGSRRFNMALLTFFAGTALLLTLIGIYGVVAFLVGRRSREIGLRVALGATGGDIVRLMLREGIKPVALGSIAGLFGSLAASRLLASQLYGVSPWDPLTLAGTIALLAATALFACWLPARRATNVHPMEALRRD